MSVDPLLIAQAADALLDWNTVLPAAFALGGVVIGGMIQMLSGFFVARQQRRYRLIDEEAERRRATSRSDADRSYVRALLARHLEAYARSCAEVMFANIHPEADVATRLPEFPTWPHVSWELLGANEMAKVRDIEVRVDVQKRWAESAVEEAAGDVGEACEYYRDTSAQIGLEAWTIACRLREEAKIELFSFPEEPGGFAYVLRRHVDRLREREREHTDRVKAIEDEGNRVNLTDL